MYSNKLVATVKVKGKVLREQGDKVFLPWNSEYSIFIKNLNTQKAIVNIEIDGENVTQNGLLVDSMGSIDLERFLGDSMYKGRKFKFIKRTSEIEDHRGVGSEDGLIRIGFQYEKVVRPYYPYVPPYKPWENTWVRPWTVDPDSNWYGTVSTNSVLRGGSSFNDPGITVKGSESNQEFTYGYIGALETESHSMIIQLVGIDDVKPITVKRKKYCPSCGREYKFGNEYCARDGTYLELSPRPVVNLTSKISNWSLKWLG
jgi:hypothetical protein